MSVFPSKSTLTTLAAVVVIGVPAMLGASLLCIWISGAESCKRMMCEFLAMRRPHGDMSYCEAWFDLFR